MSYKIIIDSCGELLDEWKKDEHFESVALTLNVGGENIIDDETFDQADFLKKVAASAAISCFTCSEIAFPSISVIGYYLIFLISASSCPSCCQ